MILSTLTSLCITITMIYLQNSLSFTSETLYPLNKNSPRYPPSSPWRPPFYFLFLQIWPHISGTVHYLPFCVWFTSLTTSSRFIHVVACIRISCRLNKAWIIFHCMYIPHCVYLFICLWTVELFPIPWLLWIIGPWIWVYKYHFKSLNVIFVKQQM